MILRWTRPFPRVGTPIRKTPRCSAGGTVPSGRIIVAPFRSHLSQVNRLRDRAPHHSCTPVLQGTPRTGTTASRQCPRGTYHLRPKGCRRTVLSPTRRTRDQCPRDQCPRKG